MCAKRQAQLAVVLSVGPIWSHIYQKYLLGMRMLCAWVSICRLEDWWGFLLPVFVGVSEPPCTHTVFGHCFY